MQDSYEKSLTPYFKFNEMIAKTTETAIANHFQSIEEFTMIGLDNFYAGINTRTVEDLILFTKKQPEVLQKTSELMVKKSQAYADLTNQAIEKSQTLFSNNFKGVIVKIPKMKIPKVTMPVYDLGESIIIRSPKKSNVNKTPKKAKEVEKKPTKANSNKVSTAVKAKKAVTAPKKTKPTKKVSTAQKKVISTRPNKKISEKELSKKNQSSSNEVKVAKLSNKPTIAKTAKTKKPSTTSIKATVNPIKPKTQVDKKIVSPQWDKPKANKANKSSKSEIKEPKLTPSMVQPATKITPKNNS